VKPGSTGHLHAGDGSSASVDGRAVRKPQPLLLLCSIWSVCQVVAAGSRLKAPLEWHLAPRAGRCCRRRSVLVDRETVQHPLVLRHDETVSVSHYSQDVVHQAGVMAGCKSQANQASSASAAARFLPMTCCFGPLTVPTRMMLRDDVSC